MPKYRMQFDTVKGRTEHTVDIDSDELLENVLGEILYDLKELGERLQGNGEPQVVWSGQSLDPTVPLSGQGVQPNDVLRVSTIATNG